jgi:hypothetical protein
VHVRLIGCSPRDGLLREARFCALRLRRRGRLQRPGCRRRDRHGRRRWRALYLAAAEALRRYDPHPHLRRGPGSVRTHRCPRHVRRFVHCVRMAAGGLWRVRVCQTVWGNESEECTHRFVNAEATQHALSSATRQTCTGSCSRPGPLPLLPLAGVLSSLRRARTG